MYLKLKKSQLTNWWIGKETNLMAFHNIMSMKETQGQRLKVIGYYNYSDKIARSKNYVVLITKDGIVTAQGSFYPFQEAHELYLQFLINANKKNTVIARNWKFLNEQKDVILADIIRNGKLQKNVEFDFLPDKAMNVVFSGVSKRLKSEVVFATFARRDVGCLPIHGAGDDVKLDIKKSIFASEEMSCERIDKVQEIFNQLTNGKEIVI